LGKKVILNNGGGGGEVKKNTAPNWDATRVFQIKKEALLEEEILYLN